MKFSQNASHIWIWKVRQSCFQNFFRWEGTVDFLIGGSRFCPLPLLLGRVKLTFDILVLCDSIWWSLISCKTTCKKQLKSDFTLKLLNFSSNIGHILCSSSHSTHIQIRFSRVWLFLHYFCKYQLLKLDKVLERSQTFLTLLL